MESSSQRAPFEACEAEFPVYGARQLSVASGQGAYLTTHDGRRILDLYGGHAAALLGYGHTGLVAALTAQAQALFFQTNALEVPVRTQAHKALVALAPAGLTRAFLVNSGAEANENALRLAFRKTKRSRVVALEGAFHGRTAAAAAVTAGSARWSAFPRTPFDVDVVPVGDLDALARAVTNDTAAIIVEAVQGVAGAREVPVAMLQAMRALATARGALLIADEIQCGMGRSGHVFAIEAAGVVPDLLTTAKGLAGGFPAGAVLATADIADDLSVGDLGTTFGGGPMACALIVEVAAALSAPGMLEHVTDIGAYIRSRCAVGPVVATQGAGLLVGLRCDRPAKQVRDALLERGVLVGTAADPYIVRLMPPLILERADVDLLAAALEALA